MAEREIPEGKDTLRVGRPPVAVPASSNWLMSVPKFLKHRPRSGARKNSGDCLRCVVLRADAVSGYELREDLVLSEGFGRKPTGRTADEDGAAVVRRS